MKSMKKLTRFRKGGYASLIAVILAAPIAGCFASDDKKPVVIATTSQVPPRDVVSAPEMEPSDVINGIFTRVGCGYQEYVNTYAFMSASASCTTGDLAKAEFFVTAYRTRSETAVAFMAAKANCTRPFIMTDHALITDIGEGAQSIILKIQQKLGEGKVKVECNN